MLAERGREVRCVPERVGRAGGEAASVYVRLERVRGAFIGVVGSSPPRKCSIPPDGSAEEEVILEERDSTGHTRVFAIRRKTPATSPTGVYRAQFLLPVSGRLDLPVCEVDTSVKPRLRVSRSLDLLYAAPPPAREEGLRLATK